MPTLQRFKLLATQCGVAQSPTRSPKTSPVVQLRRRKTTLRMLLGRRSPSHREQPPIQQHRLGTVLNAQNKSIEKDMAGHTLKDLFVSSPQIKEGDNEEEGGEENNRRNGKTKDEVLALAARLNEARFCAGLGGKPGSVGPVWFVFRKRLVRSAWRPMLVTIPE